MGIRDFIRDFGILLGFSEKPNSRIKSRIPSQVEPLVVVGHARIALLAALLGTPGRDLIHESNPLFIVDAIHSSCLVWSRIGTVISRLFDLSTAELEKFRKDV